MIALQTRLNEAQELGLRINLKPNTNLNPDQISVYIHKEHTKFIKIDLLDNNTNIIIATFENTNSNAQDFEELQLIKKGGHPDVFAVDTQNIDQAAETVLLEELIAQGVNFNPKNINDAHDINRSMPDTSNWQIEGNKCEIYVDIIRNQNGVITKVMAYITPLINGANIAQIWKNINPNAITITDAELRLQQAGHINKEKEFTADLRFDLFGRSIMDGKEYKSYDFTDIIPSIETVIKDLDNKEKQITTEHFANYGERGRYVLSRLITTIGADGTSETHQEDLLELDMLNAIIENFDIIENIGDIMLNQENFGENLDQIP